MGNAWIHEIIFLVSVFLSAVSQVILKKSALKSHKNKRREYLNLYTAGAYGLFLVSSVMTAAAYRSVPLSKGQILEAGGYIYVSFFSAVFLKEHLTKREIFGILCILTGIVIYAV